MKYVDTSDGGELKALDGYFKDSEEQQIRIDDQLKDLHGELIAFCPEVDPVCSNQEIC